MDNTITLSGITIYPVKSLGGISLDSVRMESRGLHLDRRWMLVDDQGRYITQRKLPAMALLAVSLEPNALLIRHKTQTIDPLRIPLIPETGEVVRVKLWTGYTLGVVVSEQVNEWFSRVLDIKCRLIYMTDEMTHLVDSAYARALDKIAYTDGFPVLMIGQASLDDLNARLPEPVPMDQFRPNFVFTGGQAFEEDHWRSFRIGDHSFFGVKLCARCVMTTIDQTTGKKSKEPLKTLATYRTFNGEVMFGQNVLHEGEGVVRIGDKIQILERSA